MKQKINILLFLNVILFVSCSKTNTNGAIISIDKDIYDYGNIKQYSAGTHNFEIKNKGDKYLVISEVKSSFGCTTVSYPKTALKSKAKNIIEVKYNTANVGEFHKTFVVRSNAVNKSNYILKIKGIVVK